VGGGQIQGALLSGVIAVVIALIITYLVSLVIPTTELTWALVAVGAFVSAVAGYLSGASKRR
jgi:predicted membrane-bound spermidine synthase